MMICLSSAGFFSLFLFHSTSFLLSVNLAIISTGLSLTSVGALNVTMLSTPKQYTGISMGYKHAYANSRLSVGTFTFRNVYTSQSIHVEAKRHSSLFSIWWIIQFHFPHCYNTFNIINIVRYSIKTKRP